MTKTTPPSGRALVVLSGGQDSTTCLFWAINIHGRDNVAAVTFNYGQRHEAELEAAARIAQLAGVTEHEIIDLGDDVLRGTSPLTNPDVQLDQYESFDAMEAEVGNRVEATFVPMRNALFLTIAANRAVVDGRRSLVTGVSQQDNANYPDCRLDFIRAQEATINQALGIIDFHIDTPLLRLTKAETVNLAYELPGCYEALAYSHTAYDGQYPPTGRDHASLLRAEGFRIAGLPDPLVLRAWREHLMDLPETPNYYVGIARVQAAVDRLDAFLDAQEVAP